MRHNVYFANTYYTFLFYADSANRFIVFGENKYVRAEEK